MAEVYWIRLPEHTDVLTQGYVGVTKNTAKSRFCGHLAYAKTSKGKSAIISNVVNKHGRKGLIVETLVICALDYAYDVERKLRPAPRIGWNLSEGGEVCRNYGGYKLTEETRLKMSKSKKGKKINESARLKMSEAQKRIPRGPLSADSVRKREETRFYNNFYTYPETWGEADKYYPDFLEGISPHNTCKKHGLVGNKLTSLFGHFKNGWNPSEDPRWLELKNKHLEDSNGA